MGHRRLALILAALAYGVPCGAQVPAQATTLHMRGARTQPEGALVAFDVRDGRGLGVPGVAARDVTAEADGRPVGVQTFVTPARTGTVWVLDATRRVRVTGFGETQQAFASWADSLRRAGGVAAVVAAGRPPRLTQNWTNDPTTLRAAVDNLSPRADDADLPATLRLAAQTCAAMPAPAVRCAVVFVTDARDTGLETTRLDSAAASLATLGVPVYAAVLGGGAAADALGRLVRASGGLVVTETGPAAAVQSLRARLAEGYVARLTGVPAGRPVVLTLAVQTADGRTLRDSATVRLTGPPVTSADSGAARPAEAAREGRWKLWLGLLSLLVTAGAAWLFFGRRSRETDPIAATAAPPDATARPVAPTVLRPDSAQAEAQPVAAAPAGPAEPPLRLTLRPVRAGAEAVLVNMSGQVTLGRSAAQADVAIPGDAAISAQHVSLERHGDRVLLRDLGSTNGTTVNGVPVEGSVVLAEGDLIRLGETDLRLTYDAS